MERRGFVRVLGGGVIAAASSGLAGCNSRIPDSAIEAWRGPTPELELRRWMASYAILAPHSHNLQSWIVDLTKPEEIGLRCDLNRLLPETDPYSRQIMMSHGTFIELLDIAARERGVRCTVELFPEGPFGPRVLDGRPVARVRLSPDPSVQKDPLFAQVLRRHTNRNPYDLSRPVTTEAWQAMADAVKNHPVRFGFVGAESPERLERQRAIAAEAWRIELTTPRTILESFKVLRVGASEVATHRDGLVVMDPLVVMLDRVGLFDRRRAPAPDSYATTSQVRDFDTKLESTPGFLWMVSKGNERETQVAAGRAYVRVQLAATAHDVSMQPLQQALQEYPEQAKTHESIRRVLDASDPAQTVQMWARVGHAPPVEPAPRRPLDAFVRA